MNRRRLIAVLVVLLVAVSGCTESDNTSKNSETGKSYTTNGITLELPNAWNDKVDYYNGLLSYEDVVFDGDQLVLTTSMNVSHFPKQGGEVTSIEQVRDNMERLATDLRDNGGDVKINTEITEGQSNGIKYECLESTMEVITEAVSPEAGFSFVDDWVVVIIPEYECMITFKNSFQPGSVSSKDKLEEYIRNRGEIKDQFKSITQSINRAYI